MLCPTCQNETHRFGKDRYGNQRFQCEECRKTFSDRPIKALGTMRLDVAKAEQCLQLMLEGMSVRAIMRVTKVNRNTILDLMTMVGERCEKMLNGRCNKMPVVDVQCDEIWGFVGMKEKTRKRLKKEEDGLGDAYCFIALERTTKMVIAFHLGRRSSQDTYEFAQKLSVATSGNFQLTTDGFRPYQTAIPFVMGDRVDFAALVKQYATKDDHKYSPGEVIKVDKVPCCGNPSPDLICTSHVERQNLTLRMQSRRMTRLTNAFSKKWENHQAAMALHFAYYNFCRVHMTLKTTPAVKAGIEDHVWTLAELIQKTSTLA